MPIDEWEQHKGVLAKVIDDPTWSELVVLYHNARSLRAKLTLDPTETPLTDEHVDSLARIADETGKLQETLAKPLEEGLEGKK